MGSFILVDGILILKILSHPKITLFLKFLTFEGFMVILSWLYLAPLGVGYFGGGLLDDSWVVTTYLELLSSNLVCKLKYLNKLNVFDR